LQSLNLLIEVLIRTHIKLPDIKQILLMANMWAKVS